MEPNYLKRITKIIGIILIGLVLVMGITYLYTSSIEEMNDQVRIELNKDFVKLTHGSIHYGWDGPEGGEVVVLVHGFSTPRFVFDKNIETLANAGYRVLSYDHYGRGFSDRPKVDYDKQLYDNELLELLDALDINEPINLVGYSMGGGIAAVFAGLHPDMVRRLVLMAPVGFLPEAGGIQKLLMIPGLGNWLMTVVGKQTLIDELDRAAENGDISQVIAAKFEAQFQYAGVEQALVSSMHHYPMGHMPQEYTLLGKTTMPKIMIWGTDDTTCPIDGAASIRALVPGIQLKEISGGGHGIAYADADHVNGYLLEFFE